MGTIIFILAIVIIGFYFFPDITRQVIGSVVKNAKPVTDSFLGIAKKIASVLLSKV